MAWCCTEGSLAYTADSPVIDSLGAELEAIVGTEVYVQLRHRITGVGAAGARQQERSGGTS
jgi:hypothetical protein